MPIRRGRKLLLFLAAVVLLGACGGTSARSVGTIPPAVLAQGTQLSKLVIPAPTGYEADSTAGTTGTITKAVFQHYGGVSTLAKSSFVVGYKQNYVGQDSPEGISVTLLQFDSPATATSYLKEAAPETLVYAGAVVKPFGLIPGAYQATGTKEYGGEWAHAIVMAEGPFYASVVYVNSASGPAPGEFISWAKAQWLELR